MCTNPIDIFDDLNEHANIRRRKCAIKHRKLDLTCVVCGNVAHGYNFDAISCESCKAFFRRNALRLSEKLICRQKNDCIVRFDVKKRCKRCRLNKCFAAGMRKEWILTDKEKEEKRLKIAENRRIKEIQNALKTEILSNDTLSESPKALLCRSISNAEYLTETDLFKLKSLENAYITAVKLNQTTGILKYPAIQPISSTLDLFRIPIFLSSMRLVTYFKQILEFQHLTMDEQIYLVKLNTLLVAFLHSMFIYNAENVIYHEPNADDPLFLEKDWTKTITKEFHQEMKQIRSSLNEVLQIDTQIRFVIFLINLFCIGFTSKSPPDNLTTLHILHAQNVYNELFWKYCLHHYDLSKSLRLHLQLTTGIMKLQTLISNFRARIHDYLDVTKLSPLMQSLL
ncbi:unnamed protein product [Adineta ricciae]|uniref:Nuclear receptor domain-containing protein n=1 Tax=Adineta ricciae TaxID=249248 RepID=A0A813ZEU8_ADIRI|nr:unnamed protein product [Adineta ricciae]